MTNTSTDVHPDTVHSAMIAAAAHPSKRANLTLINQVCSETFRLGGKDFSLAQIGAAVEARGGMTAKALWNPASADHRKLIEAWQAYAGGPRLRELAKPATDDLTKHITDPATRIVVEQLLVERRRLRGELNVLKANTKVVIDKRPAAKPAQAQSTTEGVTVEVVNRPEFNVIEREALEHCISSELWLAEGWAEEANGRIIKVLAEGRSRTVFKPGFVSAIRKALNVK